MAARKRKTPGRSGKPDLPKDVNAALRARQALELVIRGHSYDIVAQACGYASRSAAWTAVHRELARSMKAPSDELRELEVRRLDRYLAIADAKAAKGDLWALDRCLKIAEARRALLGLNQAPTPVTATAAVQVVFREYPTGVADLV